MKTDEADGASVSPVTGIVCANRTKKPLITSGFFIDKR